MKLKFKASRERLYSIALIFYLVWANFLLKVKWRENYLSLITPISTLLMITALALLLLCMVYKQKYSKKEFAITALIILSSVIVYYVTGANTIIFTALFVFGIKGLNFDVIVKKYAITQSICILGILATYFLDMSANVVTYWSYGFGISLGTYHPNVFGTLVLSWYLAVCYSFFKERIKWEIILALAAGIPLWLVTMSRTNCYLIFFYPIVHILVITLKKTKSTTVIRICKYTIIGLLTATLFLTFFYQDVFKGSSDGTFLARFTFGNELLKQYGIHLFGSRIQFVTTVDSRLTGTRAVVLDSAYLRLLIYYGIISTIFVLGVFSKAFSVAIKAKNYELLLVCTIIAISGVMEGMLIEVEHNFAMLAAFAFVGIRSNVPIEKFLSSSGDKGYYKKSVKYT